MKANWAREDYGAYGVSWPGTKGRWHGDTLRNPKTTQERKHYSREYGRSKRSPRHLRNSWDGVVRACLDDRSWKRHRQKQYKHRVIQNL